MKTYYWKCTYPNGNVSEGRFNIIKRAILMAKGCKFEKIGFWVD